jgi:hypothetical protein
MEAHMRFKKSIRIMKGVRLNVSKSGLSLTAGVRGASINVGSRGTYLNSGIPGTGLYNRTRIDSSSNYSRSSNSTGRSYTEVSITVGIDDNGVYFIKDKDGQIITDEQLLRKIKRTEVYKAKILELSEKYADEKNEENMKFVEIYKLSPELVMECDVLSELESMKPEIYERNEYSKTEPDKNSIRNEIIAESRRNIKSIAFWRLKKQRNAYVEEKLPRVYRQEMEKYEEEKANFLIMEDEQERQKNNEYMDNCARAKDELKKYLSGDKIWVEEKIDSFLQGMVLPVDFSVSYEYFSDGRLKVDLDLPEVEDLPTTKVTTLTSGKVKVKDKTQKEIKEEYIRCICGLAFFFASSLFNISTHISKILISGYTQRVSKKTGNLDDEYVYSVEFNRESFESINIKNIDPLIAFDSFHNVRNISKSYDLSTITPLDDFSTID